MPNTQSHAHSLFSIAKCIDTYIALSASRASPASRTSNDHSAEDLNNAFSTTANGSAGASGGLLSPTTPFSQSVLPSKSLLSREESATDDTGLSMGNTSASKGSLSANTLSSATQKALQGVIRRIFERCFEEGAYHQVVGIAVEARNLDILRETIIRASNHQGEAAKSKARDEPGRYEELMDYLLDICLNVVQERVLRNEVSCAIPSTSLSWQSLL